MRRLMTRVLIGLALLAFAVSCQPNVTPPPTLAPQPTNPPGVTPTATLAPTSTATLAPTPTESTEFQIRRFTNRVFVGLASPLPELLDDQFHPFPEGAQTNTNDVGVALLEGSAASGSCRIFVFKTTTLKKSACQPGTFAGSNSSCVEAGSALFNNCSGHLVITASGVAEHKFTALSVTYLPDQQITLYLALEGAVEVTPLRVLGDYQRTARPVELTAGQYLYTAPDDHLQQIQGIPMRVPQDADTIRPLLDELDMWDWIDQTQNAVDFQGLAVEVVPPADMTEIVMNAGGGPFNEPLGRQAILQAAPWQDLSARTTDNADISFSVSGFDSGEPVNARDYPYDQAQAAGLFRQMDYGQGFAINIIVPEGNENSAANSQRRHAIAAQAGD